MNKIGFGLCLVALAMGVDCKPVCMEVCSSDSCGGYCTEKCDSIGGTCTAINYCCQPILNCLGKECGSDGCGGSCGECSGVCDVNGQCCIPDCAGRECGVDGCGGSCGTCTGGLACDFLGKCCDGDCTGRECGPINSCVGIFCGSCSGNDVCDANGQCQSPTPPPTAPPTASPHHHHHDHHDHHDHHGGYKEYGAYKAYGNHGYKGGHDEYKKKKPNWFFGPFSIGDGEFTDVAGLLNNCFDHGLTGCGMFRTIGAARHTYYDGDVFAFAAGTADTMIRYTFNDGQFVSGWPVYLRMADKHGASMFCCTDVDLQDGSGPVGSFDGN